MLHVYGIIDGDRMLGVLPGGHEGNLVTAFPVGGLAAAVSEASGNSIETSVEHVWRHEMILSALMERHAVLPMRFGTLCTADELSALLERRREALRAALQMLAGKVELAIRVARTPLRGSTEASQVPAARTTAASSGTAYLMARAARRQEDEAAPQPVQEVKAYLEQCSVTTIWHGAAAPRHSFKASCLITRENVEGFVGGLMKFERAELQVSCTGPWAPYSFVGKSAGLGVQQ